MKPMLPVGIEDFSKIIKGNYYYIDKTHMIRDMLLNRGEVNLYTRPRRFGKSLTMSMLKNFFEIGTDKSLFDGLVICKEKEICDEYMGQFPVISLTLKQVQGLDFESAKSEMWTEISREAVRLRYLVDSGKLEELDKDILDNLIYKKGNLQDSIFQLSQILHHYYKKKVIILIDEYDVPLQNADLYGYYKEMALLISQMFGYGMKTNGNMQFAVITGCLRIAKESIFTGFNNPKVYTVLDERFAEGFGFTDSEVRQMLEYYEQSEWYDLTKEWYDGYLFGKVSVYCPWDVINWCDQLVHTSNRYPKNYWANTSGNDMIRRFAEQADKQTRDQIEALIEGKCIEKKINMELTYSEIDNSIENLWSVLFMTGYLTWRSMNEEGIYTLVIPNKEVTNLFIEQIQQWFAEKIRKDSSSAGTLCDAFVAGDVAIIERYLNAFLSRSISIRDTQSKSKKENFYHGLLLGLLNSRGNLWNVESNQECGNGYSDIRVYRIEEDYGFIIELKYADSMDSLEKSANDALQQIDEKEYIQFFRDNDVNQISCYGIAFYKKRCQVVKV